MVPYLVSGTITIVILIGLVGIRNLLQERERSLVLQRLAAAGEDLDPVAHAPVVQISTASLPPPLAPLAALGLVLPNLAFSDALQWDLAEAGYRHRDARKVFAGIKLVTTALFVAVMLLIGVRLMFPPPKLLAATLVAGLAGYVLPTLILGLRRARRREAITLALPDALDLMVVCVEAGQGLNAAMVSVGREIRMHSPSLSEELQLVTYEIRAGLSRAQALRNFSQRSGVDDIRAFTAVLIQSDRLGTSIARSLRVHADSLRTRRRQRAEEAARKTAVKLVFPLVLCIFPELLVVILAPGMIQLIRALMSAT